MKKIILFIILFAFSSESISQTYTVEINYGAETVDNNYFCTKYLYGLTFEGPGRYQPIRSAIFYDSDKSGFRSVVITNVPNYSNFHLYLANLCEGASVDSDSEYHTASALFKQPFVSVSVARYKVRANIKEFKPNLIIQKANPNNSEVCSGEMLDLAGFPAGFPNEAYHWQYSIDNQATWIDVPYGLNGIPNSNDNPNSNFSIEDLLGNNHIKYWGKKIYFRLGYENRPFTTPYEITYSPCAPIVKSITYNPPLCAGDNIQDVTIIFNRNLFIGEELRNLALIKTDGTLSGIEIPLVNAFEGTDPDNRFYSIRNFTGLESNTIYSVKYQAFQGAIARGVITTDEKFTYNEVTPLLFTATPIQPLCNDSTVGITITATGGTPPYAYILDSGTPVEFTSPYDLSGLSSAAHTIKVIDKNSCTEK
jgi:hypothetical protein